jgi:hypothetical protein
MEDKCKACIPCQAVVRSHQRTPLLMIETPAVSWSSIAVDICGPFPIGELCVCKTDERSRYPVAEIVKNTSCSRSNSSHGEDIRRIRSTRYPHKMDNGPPYQSQAFKAYCEEKDQAPQNYTKMARIKRTSRKFHESRRQSNKNNTCRRQRLEERDLHNDWSIQTCSPSKHRRNTLQGVTIRNEA